MKATLTLDLDTGDIGTTLAKAQRLVDLLTEARTLAGELGAAGGDVKPPIALDDHRGVTPTPPPTGRAAVSRKKVTPGDRRPRRKHSAEDKARGVALAKEIGVTKAAEELDVVPSVVRTWVRNHPKEHAVKGSIQGSGPKVGESREAWEARARAAAGSAL